MNIIRFQSTGLIGILFRDELDGKSLLKPCTLGLLSCDRNADGTISDALSKQIGTIRFSDLKYKCNLCAEEELPTLVHLKVHYEREHVGDTKNLNYNCSVCNVVCKNLSAYLNHVSRKHFGHLKFW